MPALGLPIRQTRRLLANCSNVVFGGAGALLSPLLRLLPAGWLPIPAAAHPSDSNNENNADWSQQPRLNRQRNKRRKRGTGEGEEEEINGFSRAMRDVATAALKVSKEYEEGLSGKGSDGGFYCVSDIGDNTHGGGGKAAAVRMGPLPRFQSWGAVGVLCISVASSQLDLALGDANYRGRRLLSTEAWAWLEDFFQAPQGSLQVQLLPFVPPLSRRPPGV